nr:hypothetical protein [uncultured bacterium]
MNAHSDRSPGQPLPDRPSLDHLRKQAKDLLRLYRRADPTALARLRAALPAARGKADDALAAMSLRLHDMQSCIAREFGCASWLELKDQVELRRARAQDARTFQLHVLRLIHGGDVAGGLGRARPELAARVLAQYPELGSGDPWFACAIGDEARVRAAIAADAAWVNRAGGPLGIPPLVAVTHSGLATLDAYRENLHRCLRLLLDAGADPNQSIGNRWPPHSIETPGDDRLSALYGAAGKLHDERMTRMLLEAGANPNDNESLYHSVEDPRTELPCTRVLLEGGAKVVGSNALAHVLDYDNLAGLELLLEYTPHGDPDLKRILHWAIHRGRSVAHVRALIAAGADPRSLAAHGHAKAASGHAAMAVLPEIQRLILQGGTGEPETLDERFVAACARADEPEARRLLAEKPDVFATMTPAQRKQLPLLAMAGRDDAVRLMVTLGWPIAERGGDIDGSALNWAVFRGRPELAEFLLRQGASWREQHGYNSDVLGTLGWASMNMPRPDGDWPGCAAALLAHGLPPAREVPDALPSHDTRTLEIDGRRLTVPLDVAEALLAAD